MLDKIIFSIIFVNLIGVIYDIWYGRASPLHEKGYINSIFGIIWQLFFRNFYLFFFVRIGIKYIIDLISVHLFIITIYFMVDYQSKLIETDVFTLMWGCFLIWSIVWSYISVTSSFLYLGHEHNLKSNSREERIYYNKANFSDMFIVFLVNFFSSVIAMNIYINASITSICIHFSVVFFFR